MNIQKYLWFIVIVLMVKTSYCQTDAAKIKTLMSTGAGYFNDQMMLGGKVLWSEIGLKLNNNYIFLLQSNLAETLNNRGNFIQLSIENEMEFLYTYKILNLLIGYEFQSKNEKHLLSPMFGPFYSEKSIVYPVQYEDILKISRSKTNNIGVALAIRYQYNINNNISAGIQASSNLGYQYGYIYGSITPVITIRY